jgi:hypothetical protein
MVLNKRERTTAIVVGVGLALVAVYYFAIDPFLTYRAKLASDGVKLQQQLKTANDTILRSKRADTEWKALLANSLKTTPTEAALEAQTAVGNLALECRVGITAMRPESALGADDKGAFQPQTFRFTGTGSFQAVSHLLYRLENPTFPVKVTAVNLSPHEKEGTDSLQVQLSIATVSYNPNAEASKTAGRANTVSTPR